MLGGTGEIAGAAKRPAPAPDGGAPAPSWWPGEGPPQPVRPPHRRRTGGAGGHRPGNHPDHAPELEGDEERTGDQNAQPGVLSAEIPGRASQRGLFREKLFETIWGYDYVGDSATADVHIGRVRDKVEDDPAHPKLIETVWGAGCRLNRP